MPAPSAVTVQVTPRRPRLNSAFAVLTIRASVSTGAAALPVSVGALPVGGGGCAPPVGGASMGGGNVLLLPCGGAAGAPGCPGFSGSSGDGSMTPEFHAIPLDDYDLGNDYR